MSEIIIDEDTKWSELDLTINDTVKVDAGAVLSVDAAAEIEKIFLTEGTLKFEAVNGINFKNPALKFKDSTEAGITVKRGTLKAGISTSVEGRYLIRTEMDIGRNSITAPDNFWNLEISEDTDLREDIELVGREFFEFYFVTPAMYYNARDSLGKIEFDRGLSEISHVEDIEINKNSLDGGSSSWVDFGRTEEQRWTVEGSFSRYWGGKRKIKLLHFIANTLQRENPVLFVSDEIFSYVMIESPEERIEGNYYDFKLDLQEVKTRYEEY